MLKIVPAILENTQEDFLKSLTKVASFAERVQIDVDDGVFGNNVTVAINKVADQILLQGKIFFETHLMVNHPMEQITSIEEAHIRKVILQSEKDGELRDSLDSFSALGCLIGLAVSPQTPIFDIEPFLDILDIVTIMTVEPGHQGNPFLPDNLTKVQTLRDLGFVNEIEIDGGIDDKNIELVAESGANTAVVGHYLIRAENPQERYEGLVQLVS